MSQIDLLNLQAPDAVTIGNHEFDYGRKNLEEKYSKAHFPVVAANLLDYQKHSLFVQPYIIKTIGNIKAAIIGLTTPDLSTLTLTENLSGLTVVSSDSVVNALIPEIKKQGANLIIVLSHMGVTEDSILASRCPDVDIIIGGHSHIPLFTPKIVNGIYICQAGTKGRYLGRVDLLVDVKKDTILSAHAKLIECRSADITPDSLVAAKVQTYEEMVGAMMKEQIGILKNDWKRSHNKESEIGDWVCDQFRSYAKADIAIQNMGGVRKDMLAGPITVRDMWEILPFGNVLMKFPLTGKEILSLLQYQPKLWDDFCQYSGLSFTYAVQNGLWNVSEVKVNGKNIDKKKIYSVVTNNYVVQQAKKYFGFEIPPQSVTALPINDREVCIEAVRKQKNISTKPERRIHEVTK
ncbi:MAG: bifunctional metallophosphatase/5'-nucleotidase [Bacteroidetes bacterium]|nr:bifunctional metallophosphatase/5'-nucleotidase [Bacteroidota bacterium]